MAMWSEVVAQVSKVLAPSRKSANAGEIMLAVSGTAIRFAIPTWLKGCYAEFTAIGAEVDVLCGGSGVDCVYGQVSDLTAEVVTTHASSGRRIVQSTTRSFVVPNDPDLTHMSIEASAGGFIQISATSQKVTK